MSARRRSTLAKFPILACMALLAALSTAACGGDTHASGISGTYEAKDAEGSMTIEFRADNKAHLTMQEPGSEPEHIDADYMVQGDQVTIQTPGGFPMTLTKNGDALQGSVMGQQIMHFRKK